ncbi:hypothetical protein L1987_52868 [Smallanthus sonchifolius]|uniref:Uncharacterized protein n=1 Tax=Smallanthus sonchifolius TaxID=185202 RepID=A0ACB9EV43_9ASTR|nr:hypothetical protein L1987_52868 [Smallanthus sonchifolius]
MIGLYTIWSYLNVFGLVREKAGLCVIDDWESDAEDVEIEFEQDDESIKYASHEGVEFDTSFVNQINELAREDKVGEIVEEIEKV